MVVSLALMAGAVLFALESYWLLPTAPWLSIPGFALSAVLSVGGVWAYMNKGKLEDLPHDPIRSIWLALAHLLVAAMGGFMAHARFPEPTWIFEATLAAFFAARGVQIYVDRHKADAER